MKEWTGISNYQPNPTPYPIATYPVQTWRPQPQPIPTTTIYNPYANPYASPSLIPTQLNNNTHNMNTVTGTHTHIHRVEVREQENMEKVYMNVCNPRVVDDDHVVYDVTLISNLPQHGYLGHSICVQKRYNDFYDLYWKVHEYMGEDAKLMPVFPGIIWYNFGIFGFNLEQEVIDDRLEKFNHLMTFIAKDRFLRVHTMVDDFFGISRTVGRK
jgi:hypothetical protein